MLNNIELGFVTPADEAEMAAHRHEIEFLFRFIPHTMNRQELWDYVLHNLPNVTIGYANGVLVGCFLMEIYTRSVELHGVVRPDLKTIVPQANRFKLFIYATIFDTIFNGMGRDKVVIKAPDSNRDVFGFAVAHGFKRLPYKDKGETVWVLTKDEYARRTNNGEEKKRGEGQYRNVGL